MARWGQGSVYLRGKTWWIQYYRHGVAYAESTHTDSERAARKLLRQRLAEIGNGRLALTEERITFEHLAMALLDNYKIRGNRSIKLAELALRRLRETFGADRAIDITSDRLQTYAATRLKQGLSNSSINYDLAIIRRAFSLMRQAGRLYHVPNVRLLEPAPPRQGFLEPSAFEKVRLALPTYLQDPIAFAYLSGWRIGEVRSLEWRDVDLVGRAIILRPENSKTKRGRVLKLAGELLAVFERAHYARRPVSTPN